MRILHIVATTKRRGAEVFSSDLVRALHGFEDFQQIAVLRASGGAEVEYEAPRSIVGPGGLEVLGGGLQLGTVRALRNLVRQWRPEVMQVHGGEALKNAVAAMPATRIPIVYRRIGGAAWITRGPRRFVYGMLMRRATRIVAVAEALRRETVEQFHVPIGRVITIPNGVDAMRMKPSLGREGIRASLGISPTAPVVLSLAALSWEKDPLAYVEVAARVAKQRPDVIHLLAGDGPLRSQVEQEINTGGLGATVKILGVRSDVADLLAASDTLLFASPSQGMEGMPACVIEAGMGGIPVVSYEVAGVPEVVIDGKTGFLVPPGDVEGLASRVLGLLNDEERRKTLGEAGRTRCLDLFDMKTIACQYRDLYQELLAA